MESRFRCGVCGSAVLILSLLMCDSLHGQTVTVTVPGTSDPYLAGMPAGSIASCDTETGQCDVVPPESPVQISGIPVTPGNVLKFSATGLVSYDPCSDNLLFGPDGDTALVVSHGAGAQNGISNIAAPASALLGVFLSDQQPSLTPVPSNLV